MNIKYNDNLKNIKLSMIEEAKKMLPLSYSLSDGDSTWTVYVNNEGIVEVEGYAEEIGIYIGKSIEDLNLSDIALLIDSNLENHYAK